VALLSGLAKPIEALAATLLLRTTQSLVPAALAFAKGGNDLHHPGRVESHWQDARS